jgi:predicted nucleotidyltransferase
LASASKDEFVFLGHPPQRIDLLQSIPGVEDFERGYARRTCVPIDGVDVNVIGFEDLLVAKRAAGRPQDLVDVSRLEKVRAKENEVGRKRSPSKDRGRDDSSR